jgi:hypothetical protein
MLSAGADPVQPNSGNEMEIQMVWRGVLVCTVPGIDYVAAHVFINTPLSVPAYTI